ncbi:MAG: ABC transporter permease subunit [Candidatus Micrarchaeota archaeon]
MCGFLKRRLSSLSKKKSVSNALYALAVLFFAFFVFFPAVYVLSLSLNVRLDSLVINSLVTSFQIALLCTALSLVFGIPLAWIIARSRGFKKEVLNSLVDMPLIIPTSALGFSVYLFWGSQYGLAPLEKGFWLITALHTAFVFPYVVRTVSAAFEELDPVHETAARSLGANLLTVFRTVSFPLVKASVITGGMLAFTRSLSETGATMMVAGLAVTAPVLVLQYKNAGDVSGAVSVSVILIVSAIVFLLLAKRLAGKMSFSFERVSPRLEARLNRFSPAKNSVVLAFFLLLILVPAFFFFIFLSQMKQLPSAEQMQLIFNSLGASFLVAAVVTVINLVFGFALALFIGRNKFGLGKLLETANEVVLVVPTSALGFSLALYWAGFHVPELLLIILAHLSFTFPYIVTPIAAMVAQLDKNLEEAAATLGATPYKILSSVTMPLILPSVLAGVVMAFMRSISETGATLAVSKSISTAPVLIVKFVQSQQFVEAAVACAVLFAISFVLLIIMRRSAGRKKEA